MLKDGLSRSKVTSDEASEQLSMADQLMQYVHSLSNGHAVATTNGVLSRECNSAEAAQVLSDYHKSRPKLRDFTLQTEVPRMDFMVIVSDGNFLTSAEHIQSHFGEKKDINDDEAEELLLRSSNQSILADSMNAISGEGRIVNPNLQAVAVARKCQFTIDLRTNTWRKKKTLQVLCELDVSVPTKEHELLKIATVKLQVLYSPAQSTSPAPALSSKILYCAPCIDLAQDMHKILQAAEMLESGGHYQQQEEDTCIGIVSTQPRFLPNVATTNDSPKKALESIKGQVSSFFNTCNMIDNNNGKKQKGSERVPVPTLTLATGGRTRSGTYAPIRFSSAEPPRSKTAKISRQEIGDWLTEDALLEHLIIEQQIALAQFRKAQARPTLTTTCIARPTMVTRIPSAA